MFCWSAVASFYFSDVRTNIRTYITYTMRKNNDQIFGRDLVYVEIGLLTLWIYFSEMLNTVVTDYDWVCSKQARATNLFTLGVVGLIIGTAIFSALADFKGRKLSFFLSTILMMVLSIAQIWTPQIYGLYLALQVWPWSWPAFHTLY